MASRARSPKYTSFHILFVLQFLDSIVITEMPFTFLRRLVRIPVFKHPSSTVATPFRRPASRPSYPPSELILRQFSSTSSVNATFNQVLRGCRKTQKARRKKSPQLAFRPEMKGVCLRVGITRPKKPNSGERKTARVRLSNGKEVTAYIPGEGRSKVDFVPRTANTS